MTRTITWSLHLERGAIQNPTLPLLEVSGKRSLINTINFVLSYPAGHYWNLWFQNQSTPGRVQIYLSRLPIAGWMTARKSEMKIFLHPTVNWGGQLYFFGKALLHEFMHLAGPSGHLSQKEPWMNPSAGTAENYTQLDYPYMAVYPWRGAKRPHLEPTMWKQISMQLQEKISMQHQPAVAFSDQQSFGAMVEASGMPLCGEYDESRRPWHDWFTRRRPKVDLTGLNLPVNELSGLIGDTDILVP